MLLSLVVSVAVAGPELMPGWALWSAYEGGESLLPDLSAAGDLNGDGLSDFLVGGLALDIASSGDLTPCVRVWYGHGVGAGASHTLCPEQPEEVLWFGWAVSGGGDLNGDGYDDLVASAPASWRFADARGSVWIWTGGPEGINPDDWLLIESPTTAADDSFGFTLAVVDDVNGDGFDELVVGAADEVDEDGFDGGAVYVYLGGPDQLDGPQLSEPLRLMPEDLSPSDGFGWSIASGGDVNGDGFGELLVGARRLVDDVSLGEVFVYYGSAEGPAQPQRVAPSDPNRSELFGAADSLSSAGDLDGDGFDDLIVGASAGVSLHGLGTVYLYYGGPDGVDVSSERALLPLDRRDTDLFGQSVSGAGDIDGDGYDDVVFGDENELYGGAVFLLRGSPDRDRELEVLGWGVERLNFGHPVAGVGDVNGDGLPELLVGGDGMEEDGEYRTHVWVVSPGAALRPSYGSLPCGCATPASGAPLRGAWLWGLLGVLVAARRRTSSPTPMPLY